LISLLRRIPVLGSVLLAILLIFCKLYLFDTNSENCFTDFGIALWAGPIGLLVSVLFFRHVLKQNRLQQNQFFLGTFFFLFVAIQGCEDLLPGVSLYLTLLHLVATYLVIKLYNKEESTNTLMAIGTLVGVGIVIDPAFIWLLPFYLLSLSYFVLMDFRKVLIVLHFVLLSSVLGFGLLHFFGEFKPSAWSFLPANNRITDLTQNPLVAFTYASLLGMVLIAFLLRSNFLRIRSVKIRNFHTLFVLSIPFILVYMLFSYEVSWMNMSLLALPVAAILTYHFENAKKAWIYESLFVLLLFAVYFTRWYYTNV